MAIRVILKFLAGLAAANIISCLIATRIFRSMDRNILIETIRETNTGEAIYLIGGAQCRTVHVFDFILSDLPETASVYLVEYQNTGFDLELATKTLTEHIDTHALKATLISISLGHQIACVAKDASELSKIRELALDPCIGYDGLKPEIKRASKLMPLGRLGDVLLGWLAFSPIIKVSDGENYSLRLLLDQFDACLDREILESHGFTPDVLVISANDQVIDNRALLMRTHETTRIHRVETGHFGTTDNASLFRAPLLPYL